MVSSTPRPCFMLASVSESLDFDRVILIVIMKKAWSVLLSVLLGAIFVGLGTGYFLHLANQDRKILANEAQQARAEALKAQEDREKAVLETNSKLAQANQEIEKAQEALRLLGLERQLLTSAKPLPAPVPKLISGWNSVVSPSLGLSFKYPPESNAANDEKGINIVEKIEEGSLQQTSDGPWLSVTPFSEQEEQVLKFRLATSTPVAYLINGRVLTGVKGPLTNSTPSQSIRSASVLKVLYNGSNTHLIWIKTPPKDKLAARKGIPLITIEDVLATLDFK